MPTKKEVLERIKQDLRWRVIQEDDLKNLLSEVEGNHKHVQIDNHNLDKLFKYFKLLSQSYFQGDPLNVKTSIEKVMLLIELELNKEYEGERL